MRKKTWLSRLLLPALIVGVLAALTLPEKALALRGGEITTAEALTEALASASAGDTVSLGADITVEGTVWLPGFTEPEGGYVTLDLNGHTLTAEEVHAETGMLQDGTGAGGTGLVKVPQGKLYMFNENTQFPIYDKTAGGYRLFEVQILLTAPYLKYVEYPDESGQYEPRIKGQYKLDFTNSKAYELLAQVAKDDKEISFEVSISYGSNNQLGRRAYTFSPNLLRQYGEAQLNQENKVFGLSFKNFLADEDYASYAKEILTNNAKLSCCGVLKEGGYSGPAEDEYRLEENLALNKPYTSTYKLLSGTNLLTNGTAMTYNSERKRDAANYADCARYTYAEDGYIQFDLGKQCVLTEYRLYNYTWATSVNNKYGGLTAWQIFVSQDGENWGEPVDGVEKAADDLNARSFGEPVTGRYVKLVFDGAYCGTLMFSEFEAYGWELPEYKLTYKINGAVYGEPATVQYGTELTAPDLTASTAEGTWVGWPDMPDTMPAENLTLEAETVTDIDNIAYSDYAQGQINCAITTTYAFTNNSYKDITRLTDLAKGAAHDYTTVKQVILSYDEAKHDEGYICFDLMSICTVYGYRMDNFRYPVQYGGIKSWSVYGSVTRDRDSWMLLDQGSIENSGSMREITDGINFAKPVEVRYIWLQVDSVYTQDGSRNKDGKVEAKDEDNIRLCEFQIWGQRREDSPVFNLAAASNGTTVRSTFMNESTFISGATTDYPDGRNYTLSNINDGQMRYGKQFYTESTWEDGYGNYYEFDFGTVCNVDTYQLSYYIYPQNQGGIKNWRIDASLDGTSWTVGVAEGTQETASLTAANYTVTGYFGPVRARYLRLVVLSVWDEDFVKSDKTEAHTAYKQSRLYEVKFFGSLAEEKAGTRLFYYNAGETRNQSVSSNSTRKWMSKAVSKTEPASGIAAINFYNNDWDYEENTSGEGLHNGERIWFSLDGMPKFNTADYESLQLTVKNLYVPADSDINMNLLDQMQILYSTDGTSYTAVSVKTHNTQGENLTIADSGKLAVLYTLWTDDILDVLPENTVITNLRVKPFGDYGYHYGALRLAEVDLTAYNKEVSIQAGDDVTVPTVEVDEDTLRSIVTTHIMQVATTTCELNQTVTTYNYAGSTNIGNQYPPLVYPAGITLRGPFYTRRNIVTASEWFAAIKNGAYSNVNLTPVDKKEDDPETENYLDIGMDCAMFTHDAIHTVSTARATYANAYTDAELFYLGKLNNNGQSRNAPEILAPFLPETFETDKSNNTFAYDKYKDYLDALAELDEGDLVISFAEDAQTYNSLVGTHVRLVTGKAVVVRDAQNNILADQSYILCTEAGGTVYHYYENKSTGEIVRAKDQSTYNNENYSYLYSGSVRVNEQYSFASLVKKHYIPMSLKVYETEKVEQSRIQLFHNITPENITDGVRLWMSSNYRIPFLDICITDRDKQEVYRERIDNGTYSFSMSVDDNATCKTAENVDAFIEGLAAGSYHITITTQSGPVLEVGGEVPTQTILNMDFTVPAAE